MPEKDRRWTFSIRELMMDFVFVAIGVGLIRLSIDERIAGGSFPNVNLAILGFGSLIGIRFFTAFVQVCQRDCSRRIC